MSPVKTVIFKLEPANSSVPNDSNIMQGKGENHHDALQFESPTNRNSKEDHSPGGLYNEGKWTDEEHTKFLKGLILYGKNWNKIQKYIVTRTCPQTRSHAQKFFRKLQKHGHLTGISTSSIAQDSLDFLGISAAAGDQSEEVKNEEGGGGPKRRNRSYSMRSDKNGEGSSGTSPEIIELEKQVVEVLKKYQVSSNSIGSMKLTSSQIPSIANDFPESSTTLRKKQYT